ncbi:MAG: ribonuclease HII [Anaplasma sp.]
MIHPNFSLEDQLRPSPTSVVVGVDEVGYGAIAGPVVAAAVCILEREHDYMREIKDSKLLSAQKREGLFDELKRHAKCGVGLASVCEIERHNILVASHMAMERALLDLRMDVDLVLVDGNRTPNLPWMIKAVIKGDSTSTSIAAASIVAKVTRDRLMRKLHEHHPGYAWNKNCGYGTKEHLLSIEEHGITAHHRRTFAPISQLLPRHATTPESEQAPAQLKLL